MKKQCNYCKGAKYVLTLDVNDTPKASSICRCYQCNVPKQNQVTGLTADSIIFRGNKKEVFIEYEELVLD